MERKLLEQMYLVWLTALTMVALMAGAKVDQKVAELAVLLGDWMVAVLAALWVDETAAMTVVQSGSKQDIEQLRLEY